MRLPLPAGVKGFMGHAAGPFTIFFWAPTFKWAITFSNIGDLQKPAEKISPYQQVAIFATGLLWTRYSFVVVPVNYNLAVANVFMAASAGFQLYRKMLVPAEKGGFWGK